MKATPENSIAICAYSRCGKTFIRKDTRKSHCTDSCRVSKSRMKTREDELAKLRVVTAEPPSLGQVAMSNEQFTELKNLLLKRLEQEKKDAASIDLMRVVESGLGHLAGQAVAGLIGATSLEDKVDYIFRWILRQEGKNAPVIKAPNQVKKQITMGMPPPAPMGQPKSSVPKQAPPAMQSGIQMPKSSGIEIPKNGSNSTPTKPFFKDGSLM